MMFMRAAIVGAPLSVGQGEDVPLLCDVAGGLAAGPALTFLAPRIAPVHVAFWIGWTTLPGALFQLAGLCQGGRDRGQCSRPTASGSLVAERSG